MRVGALGFASGRFGLVVCCSSGGWRLRGPFSFSLFNCVIRCKLINAHFFFSALPLYPPHVRTCYLSGCLYLYPCLSVWLAGTIDTQLLLLLVDGGWWMVSSTLYRRRPSALWGRWCVVDCARAASRLTCCVLESRRRNGAEGGGGGAGLRVGWGCRRAAGGGSSSRPHPIQSKRAHPPNRGCTVMTVTPSSSFISTEAGIILVAWQPAEPNPAAACRC
jgi:hypothetical protein